jgi:hypothetical protein
MAKWSQDDARAEIYRLAEAVTELQGELPHSAKHTHWLLVTRQFLEEVFGAASIYFVSFVRIRWTYSGTMAVHSQELFRPGSTQARYDRPVFLNALSQAMGILTAAADELERKDIQEVYKGKDTGPEASLILRIINLAEVKLRKTIRTKPTKEREVQDVFENLLIGADIPYSRETDSIEYSSKTYTPDFTVSKADLAIEIKLATKADHEKEFIAQINDDILAYRTKYGNLFFVVYDCGFIRDTDRFVSSFETQGAVYVRVVKH